MQHERHDETEDLGRPLVELSDTGLLWLINRTVFHPRGLALALHRRDGDVTGWSIMGDGSEVWTFTEEADDRNYATALAFLEDATTCREDFGGRCHLHAGHAGPHRRADGLQWEDETFTLTEEQIRASIERNKPLLDRLARGGDCRACVAAGPEGCEEHREGTR